jgi:Na+/H+-dicarboxylate symporter
MFQFIQPRKQKGGFFALDHASEFLQSQAKRLDALIRAKLWLQVIIGLVLGIIVGGLLGPDLGWVSPETAVLLGNWMALPGKLFLGLIGMVVSILVLASIILGLSKSSSGEQLKSVGIKLTFFVVITTTLAAALGIGLGLMIEPGSYIELQSSEKTLDSPPEPPKKLPSVKQSVPDMIAGLIPQQPLASLAKGEMLGIVVFAILIGIACTTANRQRMTPLLDFMEAVMEACMTVVKWAMFLAPWAVFGLMAQLVAQMGFGTVLGMGVYVLTVLVGLLLLYISYLFLVAVLGKMNPLNFASKIAEAQLLAFSTSSSAAVMPFTIETAVEKLKVPESIAGLAVPLCATVNMAGTALYQAVAIIFLAQMAGVELTLPELILIVVTLVASSIGSPGTPGVGLVILGNIAGDFGIPTSGLVLILGVDRILDMSRTSVNLCGDLVACVFLGSRATLAERLSPVELTESDVKKIPAF